MGEYGFSQKIFGDQNREIHVSPIAERLTRKDHTRLVQVQVVKSEHADGASFVSFPVLLTCCASAHALIAPGSVREMTSSAVVFALTGRRVVRGWQDLTLRLDLQLFAVLITEGDFLDAWLPAGACLLVVVICEEVLERSVLATL